jgi:hypothetical protein
LDSEKIFQVLSGWFKRRSTMTKASVDEDYADAVKALQALRSLFESELDHRPSSKHKGDHDRMD